MDNDLSWRRQLARNTAAEAALPLQALTELHSGTLVIGIGSTGARVLEMLGERMDDTNILKATAAPPLRLLNIQFDNSKTGLTVALTTTAPRPAAVPITSVVIAETHIPSLAQTTRTGGYNPQWCWLTENEVVHPNMTTLQRFSARVMLFNHLQVGSAAQLIVVLTALLLDVRRVYIVASALEFAGSSLIADVAALVRHAQLEGAGTSVFALVAFEDKHPNNHDLAGRPLQLDSYRAITLHELSRLTQDGRIDYRYTEEEASINYEGAMEPLLNGATLILGANDVGCRRISALLWSLLSSLQFSTIWNTAVGGIVAQHQPPSVSISYIHALYWPLAILRKRYAAQLIQHLIGTGQAPQPWNQHARPGGNADVLAQWLDTHHEGGLLDVVEFLRGNNERYIPLRNTLNELKQEADQSLERSRQALVELNQLPRTQRLVPPSVSGWSTLALSPEQCDAIRGYAGWEASQTPNTPLRLLVGMLDSNGQNVQTALVGAQQKRLLWELATRLAERHILEVLQPPLTEQIDAEDVQGAWQKRYAEWVSEIGQIAPGALSVTRSEVAASPFDSWRQPGDTPTGAESMPGHDITFIAQMVVASRRPVESFKLLKGTSPPRLRGDVLVDAPEVCAQRFILEPHKLSFEQLPLFWRNLAPHLDAILAFLACATGNGLPPLEHIVNAKPPLIDPLDSLDTAIRFWNNQLSNWLHKNPPIPPDWRFFLDAFVARYEHDADNMLHKQAEPHVRVFQQYIQETYQNGRAVLRLQPPPS